ncbi:MAG: Swt1 family HEPN domain-containing protein [Planctomycetaceae bacterium]|nr:Swt1 family HEPN domain-containing protein [Planctomycetaceae bacterium]
MPNLHQTTGRALEMLTKGLAPFFEQQMRDMFRDDWVDVARASFRQDRAASVLMQLPLDEWDAQALLTVMWDQWNAVFRQKLGLFERSLVSELREFRNRWAHQSELSDDDCYRVLDSVQRLLHADHAPEDLLVDLDRLKLDVLRERLNRQVSDDVRRAKLNRARWFEVAVYGFCGLTITAASMVFLWGRNPLSAMLISSFTLLTFGYIAVLRLRTNEPIHGVHECPKCRKIIYSEVCPYCEAPPPSSSIIRRSSSTRLPPFTETPRTAVPLQRS